MGMTEADRRAIAAYAAGDAGNRDEAIAAYRRNLGTVGPRGDDFMGFMSEVDTPVPDYLLRRQYRDRVLAAAGTASPPVP